MKNERLITILVALISVISAIAAGIGIFSDSGTGAFEYKSIRGTSIGIYGKGIYQHMSADVAIQGIAQDYITLFAAIPLLLISLIGYRIKSIKAHFVLTGISGYFLVTYLFYLTMGMYNILFLPYAILLGLSFFCFLLLIKKLSSLNISEIFSPVAPNKFVGWFLIINAVSIAFLWLNVIVPPIIDGTIYPPELNHYTTLIVQGFDLGLLLPMSFIAGFLLIQKKADGYLYATVYVVFLSLLMTALTAKIIAMAIHDVNVIPVIIIIPAINILTIICAILMVKNIQPGAGNNVRLNL